MRHSFNLAEVGGDGSGWRYCCCGGGKATAAAVVAATTTAMMKSLRKGMRFDDAHSALPTTESKESRGKA